MIIVMRGLLLLFAAASGYFIVFEIISSNLAYIGLISGVLIALAAMRFEERVKKTPLKIVIGGALGLITGLVVANLLSYPLVLNFLDNRYMEFAAYLLANFIFGYVGLSIGMKKGDEFKGIQTLNIIRENNELLKGKATGETVPETDGAGPSRTTLLVDTSVIIDGRIAEVCETGFIESRLMIPQFVLQELQYIADSGEAIKRARGKRGLDTLKQMHESGKVEVEITDKDFPAIKEVDSKLVAFAKEIGGKILTNDANLDKIAELHGVHVLNINKLATALKPVVLPGEVMTIAVVKEGKEHGQGIGYLDDGTMVVIDNGRDHVGKTVDVSITSVLQTSGGRMIFSKLKDDHKDGVKKAVFQ